MKSKYKSFKLGALVVVKGGKRLPKGTSYSDKKTDYPYLRVCDFHKGGIKKDNLKYLHSEVQKSISRYTISSDDVYISIAGSIGLAGIIPEDLSGANLTENAAKLLIKDKNILDKKYLSYYLNYPGQKYIDLQIKATSQPKLALFRIEQIPIPLPPIAEQKRIAEILDKADAVRRKRQEAIRLTEELLRSTFLEMFGDPVTNPKGWDVVKLGSTCHVTKLAGFEYTEHINYKDLAESNDVIALRALNIKNGRLKLDKVKFIDRSTSDKLSRSKLFSGDVVMTYVGVNIGDVAVIEQDDRFHLAPNVAKITPSNLDSVYLVWFLKFQKSQFAKNMTNTAKQALNMSKIRNISLLVPPQNKQKKFACLAESVEAKIANHSAALQESENLFNSLLQRAFRGEL